MLTTGVLLFLLVFLFWHVSGCAPAPDETPGLVKVEEKSILYAVKGDLADRGVLITNAMVIDVGSLYSNLLSRFGGVTSLPTNPEWEKRQRLTDPWGMDYRIDVILVTNAHLQRGYVLRVSSTGGKRSTTTRNYDNGIILVDELDQP